MLSIGMNFMRYVICAFNFLFVLLGCALVALGVVLKVFFSTYFDTSSGYVLFSPTIILVILGCSIAFITFFGFIGAVRCSTCLIGTFVFLLCVVLALEVGSGVAFIVLKGQIENVVEESLRDEMNHYTTNHTNDVWDDIQEEFRCCGISNYTDWFPTPYGEGMNVPPSCCMAYKHSDTCGEDAIDDPIGIYQTGCLTKLERFLRENWIIVAITILGVIISQVVEIIVSILLIRSIKIGYKRIEDEQGSLY